jgi:large conductance mechanosensitive channel
VRAINTMRRNTPPAPAPAPAPARSEVLLEDIRDLLAKRPAV